MHLVTTTIHLVLFMKNASTSVILAFKRTKLFAVLQYATHTITQQMLLACVLFTLGFR